jgi:diguanylate cyclase (GGDEF)-like protein
MDETGRMALATQTSSWWRRQSLRSRIAVCLALVIFAVTVILGGLIGNSSISQLRDRIGQSLATDASRIAERLNSEMAARARELDLLAALGPLGDTASLRPPPVARPPLPNPPALERVTALLDSLKRSSPAYVWIALTDPQGRVLAATDPASVGADVSTRASFREGLRGRANREPVGATTARNGPAPSEETRVMELAHPIRGADGSVLAMVVAQIGWKWATNLATGALTPDEEGVVRRELYLISNQDTVLIGPPGTFGEKLAPPSVARARAGFYGWTLETWPDGKTYLTGAAFAAGEGQYPGPGSQEMRWTVLVREEMATAFAPAYQLRDTILILGGGLGLAFAVVGWMLAGWITSPLKQIANAAERLRQGDDVELPRIHGPAEIDSLSTSLRALVATLTRKQVALDEMEELALHDPLTGLLNRNGLRKHLQREMLAARAAGTSLLVLICDLDGFKGVNDRLGHAVGDQLLGQVATRLATAVRPGDVVARLGGDEFMLSLRAQDGAADPAAREVARRALMAVKAPYSLSGHPVQIGCSLGGAAWPEQAEEGGAIDSMGLDGIMEKADAALYLVKRGGKGRLMIHGESLSLA